MLSPHPLRLFHSSVKPLFSMRSSASSRTFDYIHALNRWRPRAYSALLQTVLDEEPVNLLHKDAWSALTDSSHQSHANFTPFCRKGLRRTS